MDKQVDKEIIMEATNELSREIFSLITLARNSSQNKRMFALYNELSGRSKPLKPCNCDSKVSMIKEFFHNYLITNGFVN